LAHEIEHGLQEKVALAIHDAGHRAGLDGKVGFDVGCGGDEEAARPGGGEEATTIQERRVHEALVSIDGVMAQTLCRRSSGGATWVRCPPVAAHRKWRLNGETRIDSVRIRSGNVLKNEL
jgi:hypothetical protein